MCWGTQHGWQGAVQLAKDPDPAVRRDFREAVDESWRAAFVGKRNANQRPSQRISYPKKIAGIDSALADLVDWLAYDLATGGGDPAVPLSEAESGNRRSPGSPELPPPVTAAHAVEEAGDPAPADVRSSDRGGPSISGPVVTRVEELGGVLAERVLADIERVYDGPVPPEVKVALADHFWCDLFAHLANVLDEGVKLFDKVPDKVTALILEARKEHDRLPLQEFVVKTAVKSVWTYVKGLALFGWVPQVRRFLPVIRVLAVLICKAPERHKAVVEYCLDPLKDQLTSETKERLVKVLREWLPETAAEVAGGRPPSK